jgi:predicted amidohydrolase
MKVAAAQLAPEFKGVQTNTNTVVDLLFRLSQENVRLVVFPEAFLTGYCFSSREEALESAIESEDAALTAIANAATDYNIHAIVGYAERDASKIFNTAGIFSPQKALVSYRKTHLPFLGLDRFADSGIELPVVQIDEAKVGVGICYDVRVPEVARCYGLAGADIFCVPTNWPESAEASSDILCPARAMENHFFVVAADRVGEENGFRFIGRSKIIDPFGRILASADHREEAILIAEIEPRLARKKTIVKEAGNYELPLFESRHPMLYGKITEKKRPAPE